MTIGENTLLVKRFVWGVTVGDEGGAAKFFRSSTPRWTRPARLFVTCACGSSRAIRVAIVANRGPNETGPNNEGSFRVCDELVPSLLPLAPSPLRSTHVSDDPPGETVGTAFTKETSGAARSVSHQGVFLLYLCVNHFPSVVLHIVVQPHQRVRGGAVGDGIGSRHVSVCLPIGTTIPTGTNIPCSHGNFRDPQRRPDGSLKRAVFPEHVTR